MDPPNKMEMDGMEPPKQMKNTSLRNRMPGNRRIFRASLGVVFVGLIFLRPGAAPPAARPPGAGGPAIRDVFGSRGAEAKRSLLTPQFV